MFRIFLQHVILVWLCHFTSPDSTSEELQTITECYTCTYYSSDNPILQDALDQEDNDESCLHSPSTDHISTCDVEGAMCGTLEGNISASVAGKLVTILFWILGNGHLRRLYFSTVVFTTFSWHRLQCESILTMSRPSLASSPYQSYLLRLERPR